MTGLRVSKQRPEKMEITFREGILTPRIVPLLELMNQGENHRTSRLGRPLKKSRKKEFFYHFASSNASSGPGSEPIFSSFGYRNPPL
jgi:hypothetical protein